MRFLVQLRTGNQENQIFSLAAASLSSSQCDEARNEKHGGELERGGAGDSLLALAAIVWSPKNCIRISAVLPNDGVNFSLIMLDLKGREKLCVTVNRLCPLPPISNSSTAIQNGTSHF